MARRQPDLRMLSVQRLVSVFLVICTLMINNSSGDDKTSHSESSELGSSITKILNSFFASGYDKRVRPNYGGNPVEVGVTMFIISISTVSEVNMDFTTDFYFRQAWTDPRLSFSPLPGIENLYVGAEVADKIWVPDTFFANEKSAYFHLATTFNTFLRIGFKGDVFRSIRLTVTASCPMDLQYFPMDSQLCAIEVESYGYSTTDIKYKWGKGLKSVGLAESLSLPQFRVVGHRQLEKTIELSSGNYSRLIAEMQFARSLGFYLIQIYIPASLIVVISWVSFWLHRNATPARVSLGVTTVLTMTTLMSSTNSQLPKISYVKSIDVFLGTCFVMVFASLLEYAAVGYIGKRISMRKARAEQLAKAHEEQRKRMAAMHAAQSQPQPQQQQPSQGPQYQVSQGLPPPLPPPPVLGYHQGQHVSEHLMDSSIASSQAAQQQLLMSDVPERVCELPPPIPPAPSIGIVNPMICPFSGSPRMPYKGVYPGSFYQTAGGGYRPGFLPNLGPGGGHYDRYGPCPGIIPTSCQSTGMTRTPTHVVCGTGREASQERLNDNNMNTSSQQQQQGNQQQQQQQQLKTGATTTSTTVTNPQQEVRKSIIKDSSAPRKDASSQSQRQPLVIKPFPAKSFFGGSRSHTPSNPSKLLGVGPSDIDKYSRVIFPVCFICFNLMYWIIYSHISDNVVDDLVPLGS